MSEGTQATRPAGRKLVVTGVVAAVIVAGTVAAFGVARSTDHSSAASSSTTAAAGTVGTAGAQPVAATAPSVCSNVKGTTVMADGMVMAPVPNRVPAPADKANAAHLVASVDTGIAEYSHLSAAVAAGYVPATNPNGRIVHYADWSVVRAGDVLDANKPSSLVYANTVSGPILLGAMFLGPAPCQPGPDVAGPLTQWHAHANLCLSATHEVVGRSNASGQCAVGTHNTNTFFMMHVWTAPTLANGYQFTADPPRSVYAQIIRSGQA